MHLLEAMLDVHGCSKVTVKVNGSDDLSSKRNSSLLGSETEQVKELLFDQLKLYVYLNVFLGGCATASWLVRSTLSRRGSIPGRGHCLVFLDKTSSSLMGHRGREQALPKPAIGRYCL